VPLIIKSINFILVFAEQCFCQKAKKVCIIENEDQKEVSIIYHIKEQVYLCVILSRFLVKNAGNFINQASTLLNLLNKNASTYHL